MAFLLKRLNKEIKKRSNNLILIDVQLMQQALTKKVSMCYLSILMTLSKTFLFSLQILVSQDANGIFSAIKIAFGEKDQREVMANVVFLASDVASVNIFCAKHEVFR